MSKRPFIILDRDGVINFDSDDYIRSPEEWIPIPGSLEAIAKLNEQGYEMAVATNQAGIAKGYYSLEDLDAIHQKMQNSINAVGGCIKDIYYCPHQNSDQCDCRKPKPGLLQRISLDLSVNLAESIFIGDKISDIRAAQAAGCIPALVLTGYGKQTYADHQAELSTILVTDDLSAFVQALSFGRD